MYQFFFLSPFNPRKARRTPAVSSKTAGKAVSSRMSVTTAIVSDWTVDEVVITVGAFLVENYPC